MKYLLAGAVLLALTSPVAAAVDEKTDMQRMREVLAQVIPGETPDSIQVTPIPGLYEVSYGTQIYYLTPDGRYLISGDFIDLKGQANLTEKRRTGVRQKLMTGAKNPIVFPAKGKAKHTMTVFTDIDCGYCRKLHSGMEEMNELGIEVRYLAYPRAGLGSPSYDKAVSVWCAKDKREAMNEAKSTGNVKQKLTCDNPVASHYALGQAVGVNGTPALVLDDGRLLPGYLPPRRLLEEIEKKGESPTR